MLAADDWSGVVASLPKSSRELAIVYQERFERNLHESGQNGKGVISKYLHFIETPQNANETC